MTVKDIVLKCNSVRGWIINIDDETDEYSLDWKKEVINAYGGRKVLSLSTEDDYLLIETTGVLVD